MKNALVSGIYRGLSSEEYHNDSAVGSSSLKTLATKTPAHLKGMTYKSSPAFDVGTAVHLLVLEPHKCCSVIRGPEDRRGKKWLDFKDGLAEGDLLLTASDYDDALAMSEAIRSHELASELLSGNVDSELSVFHTDKETGLRCKIRADLRNHDANILVDVKTTVDASPEGFARAVASYSYHIQEAFYRRIWAGYNGKKLDGFYFIAVEKTAPYCVGVYELDEVSRVEGKRAVKKAMKVYKECLESGTWAGYPSGLQKIRLPTWAFQNVSSLEIPTEVG